MFQTTFLLQVEQEGSMEHIPFFNVCSEFACQQLPSIQSFLSAEQHVYPAPEVQVSPMFLQSDPGQELTSVGGVLI